ncbi:hypothetical protein, variant [Saprolegnia diclina VS20]|uniref:Phosphatidylinositol 3-kinase n=1 Tax=Saprolegnia diclina (strain VS20) TaxID=1156394 RepID=T0QCF4_SAPDV|nr:hypothetical protein, variant [Saprolegnia diclina VS20]EQC31240.1 hypothetical protein, variant [Saprolegnia diclina VS20]|eukprot:XP_008615412.1 hypothetical protein, variant [Saprolegnia diclina VS20]
MRRELILALLAAATAFAATDNACVAACVAGCSCPLGRNKLVCSNHGYCADGVCICADGWASSVDVNGTCEIGLMSLNSSVHLFVMLAACVVAIVAYTSSLVYLYYSNEAFMTHAWQGHIMNVGSVLGAASVAVAVSLDSSSHTCTVLWCCMDLAFVLVFGMLALRLYRNVRLYLASTNGPGVKLPDAWMAGMLLVLLALDGGILAAIGVLGGFNPTLALWDYPGDVDYRFMGCYLSSTPAGIAIVSPKVLYLLLVLAFALRLRRNVHEEKDMTKLAFAMLLTTVLWAIGMAVFATSTRAFGEVLYLCLVFLFLLPSAMVTFVLAFPKIIAIHRLRRRRRQQPFIYLDDDGINARLLRVAWDDVAQVEAAEVLLDTHDPDVDGALEMGTILWLLTDRVCHRKIRRYAATALGSHDPSVLRLYLPQLLQALKHDVDLREGADLCALLSVLLNMARDHIEIALDCYWHVRIELENQISVVVANQEIAIQDRATKSLYERVFEHLNAMLEASPDHHAIVYGQVACTKHITALYAALVALPSSDVKSLSTELQTYLASPTTSALQGLPPLALPGPHPLFPLATVQSVDSAKSRLFRSSAKPMKLQFTLASSSRSLQTQRSLFERSKSRLPNQWHTYSVDVFVYGVLGFDADNLTLRVDVHGKRKQVEVTAAVARLDFHVGVPPQLVDCQVYRHGAYLGAVELELSSRGLERSVVNVDGGGALDVAVVVEVQNVTSPPTIGALHPAAISVDDAPRRPSVSLSVIYKLGDDLRQDQLALQLLAIMDALLKRDGLDLCFTLYRILPTSTRDGLAEFVPRSQPLSAVLSDHNHNILTYLEKHNYDQDDGISPVAIDTFVRSVAGYCVATYLLGVGDRHLDNLMLTESGHFFHIDFGFMFGRDPKPLPPPFRLTPEMVRAMGGLRGHCLRYACTGFNILRANAHVLLGVLELSKDAGIPDMMTHMSMHAASAVHEVEKRLILRATPDRAAAFFRDLMLETQNAQTKTRLSLMERIHRIAVAIK